MENFTYDKFVYIQLENINFVRLSCDVAYESSFSALKFPAYVYSQFTSIPLFSVVDF